ncbi:MAG: B12-binding domain-containing radical SAM protein [Candidatus Omnitrophica bacterium]|nr:B12-binding domain-containing radical SAM protein [Candidatus Omnitrophota bacterium]
MATVLMIHCNRLVSGVQYPGISSMSAFAKKAGHKFIFFDTADYTSDKAAASYRSYKDKPRIDLEFRAIKNKEVMPRKKSIMSLLGDLRGAIVNRKIDVIGFSSFSDDWPFALFLIRKVRAMVPDIPIIVGGVHATVRPEQVIKHDEVSMVCVGEGELALVDLLDAIDSGKTDTSIKNLWIKKDGKVIKNPLRPLMQFSDDVPMLDWSMYNDANFYYPFEGKLYRRGSVFIGRGCPYVCNFCINDLFGRIYGGESRRPRFKSLSYLTDELLFLKERYDLEFLRFWDETFLSMPKDYLSKFASIYKKSIALPFTIETTAQTINRDNARMLAEMGCRSVSVGVETSNERLRKKVLNKPISNEAYERCFEIITEYGLRKVANFMFFLPHETLEDMWQDVRLSGKWGIDHASARIFYPYAGTELREYCMKEGMIDLNALNRIEDEGSVRDMDYLNENYITFEDTVLKVDPKTKEEGKRLMDNFILFQETEPAMRDEVKRLLTAADSEAARGLRDLEYRVYKKRFNEEPALETA